MEIPINVMERFIDDFVELKVLTAEALGADGEVEMMFLLDFGTAYKDWPFYNAKEQPDVPVVGDGERMLAVAQLPNNRTEITYFFAEMMTKFGPPEWAAVIADSYERVLNEGEAEALKSGENVPMQGDLEREFREKANTDIHEAITAEAMHVGGERVSWRQRYSYGDQGQIVWQDRDRREDRQIGNAYGFLAGLLQNTVALHGKEPYDILVILANGDEEEVQRMMAAWRSTEN